MKASEIADYLGLDLVGHDCEVTSPPSYDEAGLIVGSCSIPTHRPRLPFARALRQCFVTDPYKDYSEPWFYSRRVLRGGAWPTRSRLVRNLYRNYFTPERKDVWAGFRTCAL